MSKTKLMRQIEERIGEKLDGYLKREYATNQRAAYDIADELEIGKTTIDLWLTRFDIPIRGRWPNWKRKSKSPQIVKAEKKAREPLNEFLKREYEEKKRPATELSDFFGVHQATLYGWLGRFDIAIRDKSEAQSLAKLPRGFEKPNKKKLRTWYITDRESTNQIGERLGVAGKTVSRWIKDYGIKLRTPTERQLPSNVKKPSKSALKRLYITERKNCYEIGANIGVTPTTVRRWLVGHGIKTRDSSEAQLAEKGIKKPSKEELEGLYVGERKNSYQIAEHYGVTPRTIFNWMKSYDLQTRDVRESKMLEGARRPSKKELEKMHLEDLSSTVQIAKKMGVKSSSTIQRWMKEYGIPTQPFDAQEARKKVVDKLLDLVDKTPEQLTTTDFYRGKNRPKGILRVLGWYERKKDCSAADACSYLVEDLYGEDRLNSEENGRQVLTSLLETYAGVDNE